MQNLTTNYRFKKYGDVFYEMPEAAQYMTASAITLKSKTFDRVFYSSSDIYISNEDGISVLFVSTDMEKFDQFIVHRFVKIDPHVYFNILPVSDPADIIMYYQESDLKQTLLPEPRSFKPIVPHLIVEEILQAVYYVRKADYHGRGRINSFYEMIYVDSGTLHVLVDDHEYTLEQYDALIIDPGQKNVLYTGPDQMGSYLSIDFNMKNMFETLSMPHCFHTKKRVHQVLSHFMNALELNTAFNDELAIAYLKEALLMLYKQEEPHRIDPMQDHFESTLLNEIIVYIHNSLFSPISVEDLCKHFQISRSTIQNLFRNHLDMTPKQYISELKLSEAQKMILQHKYTISEISDQLGFTSIHYFSRKFKERFHMSPTEFAKKESEQK